MEIYNDSLSEMETTLGEARVTPGMGSISSLILQNKKHTDKFGGPVLFVVGGKGGVITRITANLAIGRDGKQIDPNSMETPPGRTVYHFTFQKSGDKWRVDRIGGFSKIPTKKTITSDEVEGYITDIFNKQKQLKESQEVLYEQTDVPSKVISLVKNFLTYNVGRRNPEHKIREYKNPNSVLFTFGNTSSSVIVHYNAGSHGIQVTFRLQPPVESKEFNNFLQRQLIDDLRDVGDFEAKKNKVLGRLTIKESEELYESTALDSIKSVVGAVPKPNEVDKTFVGFQASWSKNGSQTYAKIVAQMQKKGWTASTEDKKRTTDGSGEGVTNTSITFEKGNGYVNVSKFERRSGSTQTVVVNKAQLNESTIIAEANAEEIVKDFLYSLDVDIDAAGPESIEWKHKGATISIVYDGYASSVKGGVLEIKKNGRVASSFKWKDLKGLRDIMKSNALLQESEELDEQVSLDKSYIKALKVYKQRHSSHKELSRFHLVDVLYDMLQKDQVPEAKAEKFIRSIWDEPVFNELKKRFLKLDESEELNEMIIPPLRKSIDGKYRVAYYEQVKTGLNVKEATALRDAVQQMQFNSADEDEQLSKVIISSPSKRKRVFQIFKKEGFDVMYESEVNESSASPLRKKFNKFMYWDKGFVTPQSLKQDVEEYGDKELLSMYKYFTTEKKGGLPDLLAKTPQALQWKLIQREMRRRGLKESADQESLSEEEYDRMKDRHGYKSDDGMKFTKNLRGNKTAGKRIIGMVYVNLKNPDDQSKIKGQFKTDKKGKFYMPMIQVGTFIDKPEQIERVAKSLLKSAGVEGTTKIVTF